MPKPDFDNILSVLDNEKPIVELSKTGGGYALGSGNSLAAYIPKENI